MEKIYMQYDEKEFLKGKALYKTEYYNEYLFVEMLLRKALKKIVIFDEHIESYMLNILKDIKRNIPITIYTHPSTSLTNKLDKLKEKHNLIVVNNNKVVGKALAVDDELYVLSKAKNPRGIIRVYDFTIDTIIGSL